MADQASITFRTKGQFTLGDLRRALGAIPSRYDDVPIAVEGQSDWCPCNGYELALTDSGAAHVLFTRKPDK